MNKTIFDYSTLRGRIKEVYGSESTFAQALGIGRVSLSKRLNNIIDFSQSEMEKSALLLNFEKEKIPKYFFKAKVQKTEQNVS